MSKLKGAPPNWRFDRFRSFTENSRGAWVIGLPYPSPPRFPPADEWRTIKAFGGCSPGSTANWQAQQTFKVEKKEHLIPELAKQVKSDQQRDKHLRRVYGISLADRSGMLATQGGACAICGALGVKLVVDHCHATGRVRGLLCSRCNSGIGQLRDDPEILQKAIEYLTTAQPVLMAANQSEKETA